MANHPEFLLDVKIRIIRPTHAIHASTENRDSLPLTKTTSTGLPSVPEQQDTRHPIWETALIAAQTRTRIHISLPGSLASTLKKKVGHRQATKNSAIHQLRPSNQSGIVWAPGDWASRPRAAGAVSCAAGQPGRGRPPIAGT